MSARRHEVSPLTLAVAVALLFGVAGCGGLTTPDLSTGEVFGKLQNVDSSRASDAYVYVLGHPEVTARIESDGSYRLSGVPVGEQRLVFYDGGEKAKIAEPVEVRKASRSGKDEDASTMPRAGTVYAVARARSGAKCDDAAFIVGGARVREQRGEGGWAKLFPIPQGVEFAVGGSMKGFKQVGEKPRVRYTDDPGTFVDTPVEVEFDVDDSDSAPGCRSGIECSGSLKCDDGDGRCRECDDDIAGSCPPGFTCDHHACVLDGHDGDRDTCDPCTRDDQCGSPGVCLGKETGAGFCAHHASSSGQVCKAGFALLNGLCYPRGVLLPVPESPKVACAAWAAGFGAPCYSDAGCQNALAGGSCRKPPGATSSTLGYCSALVQGGCPSELGYGSERNGYCAP
jgi:hypothetical protein